MPVSTGRDSKGCFARWGSSGKKYYYTCGNASARESAKKKAARQGAAAYAAGYVEKDLSTDIGEKLNLIHTLKEN